MVISQVIIILLASYAIVVLVRRLNITVATIAISITLYTVYTLLQIHGVSLDIFIRILLENTKIIIERAFKIIETVIQQLST